MTRLAFLLSAVLVTAGCDSQQNQTIHSSGDVVSSGDVLYASQLNDEGRKIVDEAWSYISSSGLDTSQIGKSSGRMKLLKGVIVSVFEMKDGKLVADMGGLSTARYVVVTASENEGDRARVVDAVMITGASGPVGNQIKPYITEDGVDESGRMNYDWYTINEYKSEVSRALRRSSVEQEDSEDVSSLSNGSRSQGTGAAVSLSNGFNVKPSLNNSSAEYYCLVTREYVNGNLVSTKYHYCWPAGGGDGDDGGGSGGGDGGGGGNGRDCGNLPTEDGSPVCDDDGEGETETIDFDRFDVDGDVYGGYQLTQPPPLSQCTLEPGQSELEVLSRIMVGSALYAVYPEGHTDLDLTYIEGMLQKIGTPFPSFTTEAKLNATISGPGGTMASLSDSDRSYAYDKTVYSYNHNASTRSDHTIRGVHIGEVRAGSNSGRPKSVPSTHTFSFPLWTCSMAMGPLSWSN